ncbi:hypothetical protein [Saccharibacillus kuerlensis]|uniref:Uncharacterized protein n=1 Tax=Saccharibacillus kuerlensis TaxID=459527 RepID=A0ABQ2L5H1_9BACL|nr:hypothetical protein [Saccharibacillus kuerlensis]GGO01844.1 hypothetical protein GCM10010969_24540 [Saccharibacillus kuerlensis]
MKNSKLTVSFDTDAASCLPRLSVGLLNGQSPHDTIKPHTITNHADTANRGIQVDTSKYTSKSNSYKAAGSSSQVSKGEVHLE